jgi:hypothetical protein
MMDNLHKVVRQSQKLSIEQLRELVRSEDDVEETMKGLMEELTMIKQSLTALAPFTGYY